METLIEMLLVFCWDAIKAIVLQWLMIKVKDWWQDRKYSTILQHA